MGKEDLPPAGDDAILPSRLRGWSRLALIVAGCLFMVAFFSVVKVFVRPPGKRYGLAARCTHWWGRYCCLVAGYRVRWSGPPPPPGSLLVPNHLGYADIIALAAAAPTLFVAKAEVNDWPLFGLCCRVFEHVFVQRRRAKEMTGTVAQIRQRLTSGASVCLFAEGTSSGGLQVLPFSSSFIQPALDAGVPIVPVAMNWRSSNPRVSIAEDIAYWKDHSFVPHILRQLGLSGTAVEIIFAPPLAAPEREDRKIAARAAWEQVVMRRQVAKDAKFF